MPRHLEAPFSPVDAAVETYYRDGSWHIRDTDGTIVEINLYVTP